MKHVPIQSRFLGIGQGVGQGDSDPSLVLLIGAFPVDADLMFTPIGFYFSGPEACHGSLEH